ncbi:uncharacterized protein LOC120685172 [Panicum virgatum]|uniref:uncharacterized protein LOC120685172 n=1 Tax=Panicum virgatum TaxID=38727 RepID=UPI0019D68B43|nr:uncharacterized protein LOC120685172 [Panicum virgatum]
MLLLHILGSLRRLSSHDLLHSIVSGIYTHSYPLVSYIIGLMKASDWYHVHFAIWAVFLLLLLGNTDSLTARRLSDIDNWKSIYVKHLFKVFLMVYVMLKIYGSPSEDGKHVPPVPHLPALTAILVVVVLKWYVMIASMRMVSKSYLCKNTKVVAEYMKHKDNNLGEPFDPVTMEGYRYMVAGEKYCRVKRPAAGGKPWYEQDGPSCLKKVTTVEQIWQCKGRLLLHGQRGKLLKDLCLSMALSKMLNRRFAGFELSEAELEKTHDFVFKGLLSGDKPHQRAFRVVEEELVFVHDLYYTRYSYLDRKGRFFALCLPVIMFALCSWLTCLLAMDRRRVALTIFITLVVAFLEAYQLYLYIASGWFKVALVRSYVTTPFLQRNRCFLEMMIGLLLRFKGYRPWKGRLGQYCILRDLGRKSRVSSCLHYATLFLVDKTKKGRKNSVRLSENVKKAVVDSLLRSEGQLTNGVASLQNNRVHDKLSRACDATATDGTVTRTILVWHIATTLCEHHPVDAHDREDDAVRTASTLSRYCLHLLAFSPELLPDHISESESMLDRALDEASQLLKKAKTLESRCEELMGSITHDGDADGDHEASSIVKQGARLASLLIDNIPNTKFRWKVLSEFWAEMMLYVSPCDDARAHLEALARGGEFITHIWVLLTHAGVLKRG